MGAAQKPRSPGLWNVHTAASGELLGVLNRTLGHVLQQSLVGVVPSTFGNLSNGKKACPGKCTRESSFRKIGTLEPAE